MVVKTSALSRCFVGLFILLLTAIGPAGQCAAESEPDGATHRLLRVSARPHPGYTRIVFSLTGSPEISVSRLPSKRVRVVFRDTSSPRFRKWRSYSDSNIGGIVFSRRGSDVTATFMTAENSPGLRALTMVSGTVTLDVGAGIAFARLPGVDGCRARIQSGAEKLVRDFQPPLKTDLSFGPTDRRILEKVIPEQEVQYFLAGEAALYKGQITEAVEAFTFFANKQTAIRSLALYRLGEALYQRESYPAALTAFRDAEKLWPAYLGMNPSVKFFFAETLVRNGDLAGGQAMLKSLIREVADRPNAHLLLVHLAELQERMGHEAETNAIYDSIMKRFPGTKAASRAAMNLADRDFLTADRRTFGELALRYRALYEGGGDFVMREEALFKEVLLKGMYGGSEDALAGVVEYQKRFPRGMFLAIAATMREDLVFCRYREIATKNECEQLLPLAKSHTDYLGLCLAEDDFLPRISNCFQAEKLLRDEITLFMAITGKQWAAARLPYLYLRVVEDALALADYPLAENVGKTFIQQFPRHPQALHMSEQLARMAFQKGDLEGVISHLSWLIQKKAPVPESVESYYYLGKAFERRDLPRAERGMEMFIAEARRRNLSFPFMTDAYLVAASSRNARGDRAGALAVYLAAIGEASVQQKDIILYKMGDICRAMGKMDQAKAHWERLVKEGTDPVWKKMAQEALTDLEWRSRMKGMLGSGSK